MMTQFTGDAMTMETKMTTKTTETDVTTSPFRGPSSDGSKELTRLFRDLLAEMRHDHLLHTPVLSKAALDAIIAYEVISGAVNPVKASTPAQKIKGD
jgi:hypothetical protein